MQKNILMLVLALMLSACGSEDESQLEFYSALQHETEMLKKKRPVQGPKEIYNDYEYQAGSCDNLYWAKGEGFYVDLKPHEGHARKILFKFPSKQREGEILYKLIPNRGEIAPFTIGSTKVLANEPGEFTMNIDMRKSHNLFINISIKGCQIHVTGTPEVDETKPFSESDTLPEIISSILLPLLK